MNERFVAGKKVIQRLNDFGYEGYFVGGFVRDRILGEESNDIDITTSAKPEEIAALFKKTKATGIKYGTVTVFMDGFLVEVTTFRTEKDYVNYRKPKQVNFSTNLHEDLKRRDFTINALAMDYHEKVVDLFDGIHDINRRLIRAIGNPDERFNEDALRILRALRFVAKLDFAIEKETINSMKKNVMLISKLANERVVDELKKIFSYNYSKEAVKYMERINLQFAFNEFSLGIGRYIKSDISLDFLGFMAMSLFLKGIDIPDNWRLSKKEITLISKCIELISVTENDYYNPLLVYRLGKDICLYANKISQVINPMNNQEDLIVEIFEKLPIKKTCDLLFKGQDILELTKIKNAEVIGEIIQELEYQVINNNIENDYHILRSYAEYLMEKYNG
jgi:tRNA nucleotidyltransferase (CCA-adding enzyme)